MSKNLFSILPEKFFNPLTSKYKAEYADCILLLFNTYKAEISYGSLDRETAQRILIGYFERTGSDISFDEENISAKDPRDKANGVLSVLRECGWIEYEQQLNHKVNIVLFDYALPFIEGMNRAILNEETEYQGIVSQIYATLRDAELYTKPYALIIKGVRENTERLVSELKKLDANIKRHIEKQTSGASANEILNLLANYHQNLGSKAYYRLKTSDNISRFRNSITENLKAILASSEMMSRAASDYMEVEGEGDENAAREKVVEIIRSLIDAFEDFSALEKNIDLKNSRCITNAAQKAKLELSGGANSEGKLNAILKFYCDEVKRNQESLDDECWEDLQEIISIFPQKFISPESAYSVPEKKQNLEISKLSGTSITEEERSKKICAIKERNKNRFTMKNINEFVLNSLREKDVLFLQDFPHETKRDFIRLIYINLFSKSKSACYELKKTTERVTLNGFSLNNFSVTKRQSRGAEAGAR